MRSGPATLAEHYGGSMASAPAPEPAAAPLLTRLRGLRPALSPAEDRVAHVVLTDPRESARLTISELARAAQTSETTVLRFCRRLGLRGYPQLRLGLAEAGVRSRTVGEDTDFREGDTTDDVVLKVAAANASAVEETAEILDRRALEAAAAAIAGASRVDVYGIGASGVVGTDLQQKLHRIGTVAFAWNDPHLALTSAALLGPGDVAIGVSHSGATIETVEAMAVAAGRGATTIAVTNFPVSTLAKRADHVLATAARETALRSGATASRIAALTVVDCLYICVARHDPGRATNAVAETRRAVEGHRVEDGSPTGT